VRPGRDSGLRGDSADVEEAGLRAPAKCRAQIMPLGRWAAGPLGRWAAGKLYTREPLADVKRRFACPAGAPEPTPGGDASRLSSTPPPRRRKAARAARMGVGSGR